MKTVQQLLHDTGSRIKQEIARFSIVKPTQRSAPMHDLETDPVFLSTGGKYRSAHLSQSSAPQPTSAQVHGPVVTFALPSQQTLIDAMNADTTSRAQQQSEPTDQELDELLALTPIGRAELADRVAARGEIDTSNQETPEYRAALNTALQAMHAQNRSMEAQYAALKAEQEARESTPEIIDSYLQLTPIGRGILSERGAPLPDAETRELLALTPMGRGILRDIDAEQQAGGK